MGSADELSFPDDFFKEEIREGFTVPEMMKRAWAAELKVLKAIEDLFNKLDITYYIEYGTLLGAVRHQGFIPWDDDIDIAILRSDFKKLIENEHLLPYPYRILSVYNSDTYHTHNGLATNNRADKLEWDKDRIRDFYGCPYIINLDINPLDYIPRDKELRQLQRLIYYLGYSLTGQCVAIETAEQANEPVDPAAKEKYLKEFDLFSEYLKKFFNDGIRIDPDRPVRNELCRACDMVASLCYEEDADYLDYYPHMVYTDGYFFRKKEWYQGQVVQLPFETTTLSASASYMDMMEPFFGSDYMTPKRGLQVHDYPFYAKQEEYFRFMGHNV